MRGRSVKALLVLTLIGSVLASAQPADSAQQPYRTMGDWRMSVSTEEPTDGNSGALGLRIELQNVAGNDLVLNLGMMLGNGRKLVPTAITVRLADSGGEVRVLPLLALPGLGGVVGRIDDFVVGLPTGGIYVLTTKLDRLAVGRYRVAARFEGQRATYINSDTPGMRLLNFWTGSVQSNTVDFEVKK
jgi:hypothetical protein